MLVKLYDFNPTGSIYKELEAEGIIIRRAMPPEKSLVLDWVTNSFEKGWANECERAFSNTPISCFIAVDGLKLVGFSCAEATCRDYFGPTGVDSSMRGKGVGKALLQIALEDLKARGYAYAIIGDAGPSGFYERFCGATPIAGSSPGIYKGMLR